MTKGRFILLLLVVSLCSFHTANADPNISSIFGTLSDTKTVTIGGSDFGLKSTAAPIRFEQFEEADGGGDPIVGHTIANDISYWGGGDAKISNDKLRGNSKYCAKVVLDVPNDKADLFYKNNIGFGQKFYVNYWVWFRWSDDLSSVNWNDGISMQHKHVYVMKEFPGGAPTPDPGIYQQWYWHPGRDGTYGTGDDYNYIFMKHHPGGVTPSFSLCSPPKNTVPLSLHDDNGAWINVAMQVDQGNVNTANGSFEHWQSNVGFASPYEHCSNSNRNMRYNNDFDAILVGWYLTSVGSNTATIYFDNIYLDSSWARVEIGDNQNYNSCTHRELQMPTSWSHNSITINVNQGLFANGETVYLYVVDENGDVSDGHPATIGGGGGPGNPPNPPAGLEIVNGP